MSDDEETGDPRVVALRTEYAAERWLVSLAAGWAYVDERTRELALFTCMQDGTIGFRPLLGFLATYLRQLGSEFVEPEPLAWATAELEHHPINHRSFVDTLEHLDGDAAGAPPIDQLVETATASRMRRRLIEVACRLGYAASTADLRTVRWLLSFIELHALPDPPSWFAIAEGEEDDDEPTPHQWEEIAKEHEKQNPKIAPRRRLPVVNTTDFNLWFMIHQCAFMKMMRASDNHDYQLWVAMASQLQPYGDRGRDMFMKISMQDSHLAPEIIEQKWEQTRSMLPLRCTTIERWGWRCQHLDTVRCNGAPTPALLADHSYCEPMEVEITW